MLRKLQKRLPEFKIYKKDNFIRADRYDNGKGKTFCIAITSHKDVGLLEYSILKAWEDRND